MSIYTTHSIPSSVTNVSLYITDEYNWQSTINGKTTYFKKKRICKLKRKNSDS